MSVVCWREFRGVVFLYHMMRVWRWYVRSACFGGGMIEGRMACLGDTSECFYVLWGYPM